MAGGEEAAKETKAQQAQQEGNKLKELGCRRVACCLRATMADGVRCGRVALLFVGNDD